MCIFCERLKNSEYNFNDKLEAEQCEELRSRRKRVTLVTGFLGAGKTTFLNYVLQEAHGKKLGVLVNEFGETAIDDALIVSSEGEPVITMANGCVCCKVRTDLVDGLEQLSKMEIEAILLETSGLSEVLPVCQTFFDPRLQEKFSLDAVITVLDASAELDPESSAIQREQLLLADVVLLNKIDKIRGGTRTQRITEIKTLAPHAEIIPCRNSRVNLDQVLNLRAFELSSDWYFRQSEKHLHTGFESTSLSSEFPLDGEAIKRFLQDAIDNKGVIRCKGVVIIRDEGGESCPMIIQGVGGHVEMEKTDMEVDQSKLVLIGHSSKAGEDIQRLFRECEAQAQNKSGDGEAPLSKDNYV